MAHKHDAQTHDTHDGHTHGELGHTHEGHTHGELGHTHEGHTHENKKAVLNRMARIIGHMQ